MNDKAPNLYRRNGIWYYRVQIEKREYRQSLGTRSKTEALRRRRLILGGQAKAPTGALLTALEGDKSRGNFIYFIRAERGGPIKIGRSRAPKARLARLQTASALPLRLLACVPASTEVEMLLHERFARERLEGEWFKASPRLLRFVGALAEKHPDYFSAHEKGILVKGGRPRTENANADQRLEMVAGEGLEPPTLGL
jgi:hypothetical protein